MREVERFARTVLGVSPNAGRAEARERYQEVAGSLRQAICCLRRAGDAVPERLVEEVEDRLRRVEAAHQLLADRGSRRAPPGGWSIRWSVCPACLSAVPWQGPRHRNRLCTSCRTSHLSW
jgi:hypothetical protein